MKRKGQKNGLKSYFTICCAALLALSSCICSAAAETNTASYAPVAETAGESSGSESILESVQTGAADENIETEAGDKSGQVNAAGESIKTEEDNSAQSSDADGNIKTEAEEEAEQTSTSDEGTKTETSNGSAQAEKNEAGVQTEMPGETAESEQTVIQENVLYETEMKEQASFAGTGNQEKTLSGVWNASNGTIRVDLRNLGDGSVTSVKFAVWSESNGQDDLVWYSGTKNTDGGWSYTVPLKQHSGTGTYFVHAYRVTAGGMKLEGGIAVTVAATKAVIATNVTNSYSGAFRVTLDAFTVPETVKQVKVAVWSKANGQDDLVWTDAKKSGTSWYADVDTTSHQYDEGIYYIHVYVVDNANNMYFCTAASQTVTVNRTKKALSGVWNASSGTLSAKLSNAYTGRDVKDVKFAVWSEANGQDDLVWYSGIKNADGSWSYTVPLKQHSGTGTYFVHAYRVTADGMKLEGGIAVTVAATKAVIATNVTNSYSGAFRVTLDAFTVPETVKQVKVAVWSKANGQDDLVWTDAKKSGTSWYADVDTTSHQYDEGIYYIHVYVVDNANNMYFCTAASQTVTVNRSNAKLTVAVDSANATMTIKLLNAYLGRNVKSVSFPVWTTANGQDDIVWHKATKNSDGTWTATVNLGTHNYENGTYLIHAYQETSSGKKIITGTSVSVKISLPYVRQKAIEILNRVGWNLRAAFNWSAGLTYYRPTPKPESGTLHTVHYGEYGFRNNKGNCYVMAATFYWMAKELGYEVYMVEGYVPYSGGGITVHGWTEVIINGVTYVCDPNFTNETGRNGYMITYGTSGTWVYQKYQRVQ